MTYTVDTARFSYPIIYANKKAFEAQQDFDWAKNRFANNCEKIVKLQKQMKISRNKEYEGEFLEEIEELKFYNQFLKEFADTKWKEFKIEGGILNQVLS